MGEAMWNLGYYNDRGTAERKVKRVFELMELPVPKGYEKLVKPKCLEAGQTHKWDAKANLGYYRSQVEADEVLREVSKVAHRNIPDFRPEYGKVGSKKNIPCN